MNSLVMRMRQVLVLMGVWALTACGGSGSGMSTTMNSPGTGTPQACNNCGTAMVSLTDAPGDFISYLVKVVSLQLKRADGTVVETVPVTTQVDFAQLVNLSEIISTDQIPAGSYVSAAITLDFSSATIVVDNGTTGVTIAAGNVINGATSMPLMAPNPTQMTLNVNLGSNNQLIVTPHTIANLALDFNLAASNTITPSNTSPTTVTVNPVLTAGLVPDTTKQIRVRGSLVSADVTANSYVVNVHPFYDSDGDDGQFTVNTTATTTYSINNMSYTGSAGLTQLATLAAGTMVVAYGTWDKVAESFTATNVLAGTSVPGVMHDSVEGTVLSRTMNTLVVSHGLVHHEDMDDMDYAPQVTVTLGTATTVSEDGQSGTFTIQDISVGQHLQLSGILGKDSSGNTTLDATAGAARLMLTSLSGTVTALATNLVTVNLNAIDGQAPSRLNFAGTGTTTAMDATATAYSIGVPTPLSTMTLSSGVPVRFEGFVAPFGMAPPDFNASTLVNYADTRAVLEVEWASPGSTAPFATLTSTALLINQATLQASVEHRIRIGFATLDPSTVSTGLQLVPDPAATSMRLAIGHIKSWNIEAFTAFGDFVTALQGDLNGTAAVMQVDADGPYDATTGVLSVDHMIVVIND
jgi:hypothetical protein